MTDLELESWTRSVPQWTAHAERIAAMTAEATAGLLARLRPAPGQRLLDVAAGTGDPSLRLAELVGPAGHVTATDGVPGMLATLSQRARKKGLANVSTRAERAEELSLPAASFDGACSRFGVMFFADTLRALRNVRRAVRPGGRLVLAAWGAQESNPYFTLPAETLDELGVADPVPAGARTVFEYSAPDRLASLLREAGWSDVREERAAQSLPLADTPPDRLLDVLAEISLRVAERIQPLAAAAREAVRARLAQRATTYAGNGGITFPAEVLYVFGRA